MKNYICKTMDQLPAAKVFQLKQRQLAFYTT
jgi:hypothetical protein